VKLISLPCTHFIERIVLSAILVGGVTMLMPANAAGACTLYVSPTGKSTNSGTSPSSPITLLMAPSRTQPGSVVCLLAGSYYISTSLYIYKSGTSSNWIVFTNYNGAVAVIVPTAGFGAMPLFRVNSGTRYIEINGLQFEGQNDAETAIACSGCDHLRVIGNKISHMGASGIITFPDTGTGKRPDYITADHNLVYHCGYNQGFGSAISYEQHGWYDTFAGFHSFVTNNIISGMYDNSSHHTDGNGIISDNQPGDVTPPELIANNVVYQNGRRCISAFHASNAWVVNNTCYKNDLYKYAGELQTSWASGTYEVNNISYGWSSNSPYLDITPLVDTNYHYNQWITSGAGTPQVTPSTALTDPAQLKKADPVFVNPPYVSPTGSGQYNNAVPPAQITDQFHLQSGSHAIAAGIDPTTIPGIASEIVSGLKQYVYTDIEGHPRTPSAPFDLGAYAYSGGSVLATLIPVADTYVNSGYPGGNYGSTTPLKVGGSGVVRVAYLKFDLTSLAGKTLTSATLRLWLYNGASGTYTVDSVGDTSWTESGTTYLNRPTVGSAIGSVSNPVSGTWMQVDVTADVKANLGKLISFATTSASSHTLSVHSREAKYIKPQLVIQ